MKYVLGRELIDILVVLLPIDNTETYAQNMEPTQCTARILHIITVARTSLRVFKMNSSSHLL